MANVVKSWSELLSADDSEVVLIEVEGQHSAFLISLELSEQEHQDRNDSVSVVLGP